MVFVIGKVLAPEARQEPSTVALLVERLVFQKPALHLSTEIALMLIMPRETYIREIYTREESAARSLVQKYFQFYPKSRYETEVESWSRVQLQHCQFTLKRLREPKGNEKP